MTTEQVYTMAGAESEMLDHIKSRKLRYGTSGTSWDFHTTILRGAVWWRDSLRASEDVEDRGCAGWTTSWRGLQPVGGQLVARYTWQTSLVISNSSTQPTVAPRRRRCDMTCDMTNVNEDAAQERRTVCILYGMCVIVFMNKILYWSSERILFCEIYTYRYWITLRIRMFVHLSIYYTIKRRL